MVFTLTQGDLGVFNRILAAISLISFVFLVFLSGIAVSYLKLSPYLFFTKTWQSFKAMTAEPDRLMPIVHDFTGVRIHDREAMAPGTTFVTSYFPENDWHAGARLIDADGTILHSWNIDANAIFGRKLNLPYIHGSYLFPNGDILVSYEFVGLARVSACGELRWKITDPLTHHSVSAASDGTFWVSANRALKSAVGRDEAMMKILGFPVYEDLFLHVSADGDILQEISSIAVIDKNNLYDAVMRTGRNFEGDIFHLNDVDVLSPEMADQYPLFTAGDIVVSMRDLHMLIVLDPATLKVKWYSNGTSVFQHDADFIGNGWIGVFDNRYDRTERGDILGGSRIPAVRPDTGEEKVLFPTHLSPPFYTKWSGKWQKLANGNLLLTEARAGRALEVTAAGAPVWEWVVDRYDAKQVPEVMEATRYQISAETAATWTCD